MGLLMLPYLILLRKIKPYKNHAKKCHEVTLKCPVVLNLNKSLKESQ